VNEQSNILPFPGSYSPPGPLPQGGNAQDLASARYDQLRMFSAPNPRLLASARQAVLQRRRLALQSACEEASQDNWDGYGALAVCTGARERAQRFLDLLPTDLPDPQVAAHPDGAIGFEWHPSRDTTFSLSVSGKGDVAYAGVSPEEKTFGTLVFDASVPRAVLDRLRNLYATGSPSSYTARG